MNHTDWRALVAELIRCDGGKGSECYHAGEYYEARMAVLAALASTPAATPDHPEEQGSRRKPENKIIAGLNDASAYARGDKSRGREFTITPDTEAQRQSRLRGEMAMGESVAGKKETLVEEFERQVGDLNDWVSEGLLAEGNTQARSAVAFILRRLDHERGL